MVPENDPNPFCVACRLNVVIPALADYRNRERWRKLELAKRRCIYTLLRLGLALEPDREGGRTALRFRFLQDQQNAPVETGHLDGVVTINIAEADEDERERRRVTLNEPYRTLVGHLRHESGHFYWDQLIAGSPNLPRFRELFGDETLNYEQALQWYYQQGPAPGWQDRTITAYASCHPWEDWAESWAHYLHMTDTLETASACGVALKPRGTNQPALKADPNLVKRGSFECMLDAWFPLTYLLNNLNRGLGLADGYPFVLSTPVIEKLRFVHETVLVAAPRQAQGGLAAWLSRLGW
jgi:hypothetical protein